MDLSQIQVYCLSKPHAEECRPFGEYPICYKVCGRIFAQIYPNMITVKCTCFAGELFRSQYPGIVVRGYHCPPVQQPYWNTIYYDGFPQEELPVMIDLAYEAVSAKLTKKQRQTLMPKEDV